MDSKNPQLIYQNHYLEIKIKYIEKVRSSGLTFLFNLLFGDLPAKLQALSEIDLGGKKVEVFLIMLFMLILPWITRLKVVKLDEISAQYFQNSNGSGYFVWAVPNVIR